MGCTYRDSSKALSKPSTAKYCVCMCVSFIFVMDIPKDLTNARGVHYSVKKISFI